MSKRSSRPKEATPPPELSPQQRTEKAVAAIQGICNTYRVGIMVELCGDPEGGKVVLCPSCQRPRVLRPEVKVVPLEGQQPNTIPDQEKA